MRPQHSVLLDSLHLGCLTFVQRYADNGKTFVFEVVIKFHHVGIFHAAPSRVSVAVYSSPGSSIMVKPPAYPSITRCATTASSRVTRSSNFLPAMTVLAEKNNLFGFRIAETIGLPFRKVLWLIVTVKRKKSYEYFLNTPPFCIVMRIIMERMQILGESTSLLCGSRRHNHQSVGSLF